jgi:hypothetical protein
MSDNSYRFLVDCANQEDIRSLIFDIFEYNTRVTLSGQSRILGNNNHAIHIINYYIRPGLHSLVEILCNHDGFLKLLHNGHGHTFYMVLDNNYVLDICNCEELDDYKHFTNPPTDLEINIEPLNLKEKPSE